MTTVTTTQTPKLIASLARAQHDAPRDQPDWLAELRGKAMERFMVLGLPTSKHEDWRFTNIAPVRQTEFALPDATTDVTPEQIEPFAIPNFDCHMIVFVNGRYREALSNVGDLPAGVTLQTLADALAEGGDLLEQHFGQYADIEDKAFAALNTALADDGIVLHVPQGAKLDKPVHLLNVTVADDAPVFVCPRNLIVVDNGGSATVVEDYVSLREDVYFNNALTEIAVGDNAHVTHYLLDRESEKAFNVSELHARQGRDSRFLSHSMLFGGAIVRNNVRPILDGDNCFSLLNGLYVIDGDQIADSHMRVEHRKPHGDSRQYYNGIMHDNAKGVFRGRIVVSREAQKTDAKQSNQNLLLSDSASANADPQLEIYADDVKCTHGATIGQINEDQIFYLMARGIPRDIARSMIVVAFASEGLDRIEDEPIRTLMKDMLMDRLPEGDVLIRTPELDSLS
jgi:Fe-S cluster assembly protein SufD